MPSEDSSMPDPKDNRPQDPGRRRFLQSGLAGMGLLLAGSWSLLTPGCTPEDLRAGVVLGPDMRSGHRLRSRGGLPAVSETREIPLVIVGAGIAGLTAGWWLKRNGFDQFVILELEDYVGGNSHSMEIDGKPVAPWGAHYLPVPGDEQPLLLELLREMGALKGYDKEGKLIWDELALCHAPEERLLIHGHWQEGIVPNLGLSEAEQAEMKAFFATMERMKHAIGKDGKPAFCIPIDLASQDRTFTDLDQVTMADWMRQQGWNSEPLHWYVNYCCRDDFGTRHEEASAWAGIHYFAARKASSANAEAGDVLAWPEGNGRLVQALCASGLEDHILSRHMACEIRNTDAGAEVLALDLTKDTGLLFKADAVLWAGPRNVAQHVVRGKKGNSGAFTYAPWLVANLELSEPPVKGNGTALAWDNVSYRSDSLGYVHAGHQLVGRLPGKRTRITWYTALTDQDPNVARKWLQDQSYDSLRKWVLEDLERMHPGISETVLDFKPWTWGHAMIRPTVGFIHGPDRTYAQGNEGSIFFAHSDLSGISIFEEAFYQGTRAARQVLQSLRGNSAS